MKPPETRAVVVFLKDKGKAYGYFAGGTWEISKQPFPALSWGHVYVNKWVPEDPEHPVIDWVEYGTMEDVATHLRLIKSLIEGDADKKDQMITEILDRWSYLL